jgi:hypothetical protein
MRDGKPTVMANDALHRVVMVAAISASMVVASACAEQRDPVSASRSTASTRSSVSIPQAGNPELAQLLAAIRDTTDQYHDVNVALAAGYRPSAAGCESSSIGAMGIHYGHPTLLGLVRGSSPVTGTDPNIDFMRPEIVIYEPQLDGSRRLVAVEYVVYKAAWDAAHSSPPTLLGVPFDVRTGANAHGHADHYELHIWLWRHNPLGLFAPWNPKVTCP